LKNREATLKVLLDTPFLHPSLGIDVGEDVLKGLRRLAEIEAETYYSRFSILESLWVATRLIKNTAFNLETFRLGLRSVMQGDRYRKTQEDSEIFNETLKLHMLGHKDMVDNILYASSNRLNLKLLTLDKELKEFIHAHGLNDTLLHPDQIVN